MRRRQEAAASLSLAAQRLSAEAPRRGGALQPRSVQRDVGRRDRRCRGRAAAGGGLTASSASTSRNRRRRRAAAAERLAARAARRRAHAAARRRDMPRTALAGSTRRRRLCCRGAASTGASPTRRPTRTSYATAPPPSPAPRGAAPGTRAAGCHPARAPRLVSHALRAAPPADQKRRWMGAAAQAAQRGAATTRPRTPAAATAAAGRCRPVHGVRAGRRPVRRRWRSCSAALARRHVKRRASLLLSPHVHTDCWPRAARARAQHAPRRVVYTVGTARRGIERPVAVPSRSGVRLPCGVRASPSAAQPHLSRPGRSEGRAKAALFTNGLRLQDCPLI